MIAEQIEDIYELSPVQQGMLFESVVGSRWGTYLLQFFVDLEGELDAACFTAAWNRLAERHPVFRTSFHWGELEKPLQVVHRRVEIPVRYEDWRGLDSEDVERRLARLSEEDRQHGLELTRPPLVRLVAVHTGEERWCLLWTVHHLLLDGWCLSLVLEDLLRLYAGEQRGGPAALPEAPPYSSFIEWLQEHGSPEAAESFWREHLRGAGGPTPLGIDRRRAAGEHGEAAAPEEVALALSAEETQALATRAASRRLTLNSLALAAWARLLSLYSGQRQVVLGVVSSGRPSDLPGAERTVGPFVSTLPVHLGVSPERPVDEWLQDVQRLLLEVRQHEHTALVEIQGWSEMPRGVPLFESLFVFESYPRAGRSGGAGEGPSTTPAGSLRVGAVRSVEGTNYPLNVIVVPGSRLVLRVSFDRHRIRPAAGERLLGHLATLLRGLPGEGPVGAWSPLTPEERRQIVSAGRGPRRGDPSGATALELFRRWARETPGAPAVLDAAGVLSYGELDEAALELATRLGRRGVGPGTLVAVSALPRRHLVVAVLGVLEAGGAFLPLDPSYPLERLAFMAEDAGADLALVDAEAGERLASLPLERWPIDRRVAPPPAAAGSPAKPQPDDLAYVIYTSGSTGRPKGVMVPQRGMRNLAEAQAESFGAGPGDVVMQFSSASFDAFVWELTMALTAGAALCLAEPAQRLPGAPLAEVLRQGRVTHLTLPPSALALLPTDHLPDLRLVVTAGEAVGPDLVDRWAVSRRHVNAYGPTEASVCATWADCRPGDGYPPLGRALRNVDVVVVDEALEPAPHGVAGELVIGGAGLARGYLGRPSLTAERFVPSPFAESPGERLYRTGDLVRLRMDGELEFLGRLDQQVKLRGFRIEPGEIEAVLSSHPAVRRALVLLRGQRSGDRRLVAYAEVEPGSVSEAELRLALRRRLPEHMVPGALVLLEEMPLLPGGKVDRSALPAPVEPEAASGAHRAPGTELEELVASVWCEVLERQEVGVDDAFFDLGGHSLMLLRVQRLLVERLSREVPIQALLRYPTIATLAAYLAGGDAPTGDPAVGGGLSSSPSSGSLSSGKEPDRTE